jgi:DNA-binding response OmpR family regulator
LLFLTAGSDLMMTTSQKREESSIHTRQEGARVLLAEDDDEMRSFLGRTLHTSGYDVLSIANAGELHTFLDLAASPDTEGDGLEIDLIISDLSMPGKSAIDILLEFREVARHIPIVLITAFGDEKTQKTALDSGATAVFDKPFAIEELKSFLLNTLPPLKREPQ